MRRIEHFRIFFYNMGLPLVLITSVKTKQLPIVSINAVRSKKKVLYLYRIYRNYEMGQVKNILIDYDEKISVITDIINLLSSNDSIKKKYSDVIADLETIQYIINNLNTLKVDSIIYIKKHILSDLDTLQNKIQIFFRHMETDTDWSYALVDLMEELRIKVNHIKMQLITFRNAHAHVYNSEDYYQKQIEELNTQKLSLEKKLNEIQIAYKGLQGHNQKEKDILSKEIREKEMQVEEANQQLIKYQVELAEKKKQENAIAEWNNKIRMTFTDLKSYLHPIRNEHTRLKTLYWIYLILSCFAVFLIICLEFSFCLKFTTNDTLLEWKEYLIFFLPVPISGTLLWVFISQMNRAQRQLVILAKHIHETEYVEGLLLSLNSLSTNMNESMKRINTAIDKLLENHLSTGKCNTNYNEESIIKEEKKDVIPIEVFTNLIKDIKSIITKEK